MSTYTPNYDHCGYLRCVLETENLKKNTDIAVEKLKLLGVEFDAIAFRGMSGCLAAPIIAVSLNKTMIMVRKKEDDRIDDNRNHSTQMVEGDKAARTYIIIDDFFSTGTTARKIQEAIKRFAPQAKCLGGGISQGYRCITC